MSEPIGIPDVAAMADVLDDLAEHFEEYSLEHLLALRDALVELAKQTGRINSLIKSQLLVLAKEPVRTRDGRVLYSEPDGKYRPDHDKIKAAIVSRAVFDDNGETISNPTIVAVRAVDLAYKCFVAPSDMPKKGGLAAIDRRSTQVADWEQTGYKLVESAPSLPEGAE